MQTIEKHIASPQENPRRLSEYAIGIFESIISKQGIKKAIKKDLVKVNGKIGQTSTFIFGGEIIELLEAEEKKTPIFELELPILFEDEYLAIINKPAGIEVSGNKFRTIENALPHNFKKSTLPDALSKPQPIHRLDFPTTGVLLIGKTKSSVIALNKLFEEKKIKKTYYTITLGKEKMQKSGSIETVVDNKKASSKYEVLASEISEKFGVLNLVKLFPQTGRKHQLRVHLSGIGHPILGDKMYGKEGLILQGKGLYLHASNLEFQHPKTSEVISVTQKVPNKFKKIFSLDFLDTKFLDPKKSDT